MAIERPGAGIRRKQNGTWTAMVQGMGSLQFRDSPLTSDRRHGDLHWERMPIEGGQPTKPKRSLAIL